MFINDESKQKSENLQNNRSSHCLMEYVLGLETVKTWIWGLVST